MNMVGIEKQGIPHNRFQFNAQTERETAFGLHWDETPFRRYDAQIGRFHGVDALASEYAGITPYQYAFNNPVMFNDPTGLLPDATASFGDPTTFMDEYFNGQAGGDHLQNNFGEEYSYNWGTGNYVNDMGQAVSSNEAIEWNLSFAHIRKELVSFSSYKTFFNAWNVAIARNTHSVEKAPNTTENQAGLSEKAEYIESLDKKGFWNTLESRNNYDIYIRSRTITLKFMELVMSDHVVAANYLLRNPYTRYRKFTTSAADWLERRGVPVYKNREAVSIMPDWPSKPRVRIYGAVDTKDGKTELMPLLNVPRKYISYYLQLIRIKKPNNFKSSEEIRLDNERLIKNRGNIYKQYRNFIIEELTKGPKKGPPLNPNPFYKPTIVNIPNGIKR